jgi:hypothetical protein
MPRSWLRRHGALTAEKHHELAALLSFPDENQTIRPKGPLTPLLGQARHLSAMTLPRACPLLPKSDG